MHHRHNELYIHALCQAEDTEELAAFRRQWQQELRHDANAQHSDHKQKETQVQDYVH